MKKTILAAGFFLLLTAVTAMAQMMGPGQHMMQQQSPLQQQYNPYMMHPGMMGNYGYGMPSVMGGFGYGMAPHMMGGHPMHHGMMGGYGWGIGPYMMMGSWPAVPPCTGWHGPSFKSGEEYTAFLDETKELRRKLHNLMFDYGEALRSPEPDKEKLQKMEQEIYELRSQVFTFKTK